MIVHGVCSVSAPETPVPKLDRCRLIIGDKMRTLLYVIAVLSGPLLILGGCSLAQDPNYNGGWGGGGSGGSSGGSSAGMGTSGSSAGTSGSSAGMGH
jgi:hypothetical protein